MKIVRTIGSNVVIRADLDTRKLSNVIQAMEKKLTFIGTVICVGPDVKKLGSVSVYIMVMIVNHLKLIQLMRML